MDFPLVTVMIPTFNAAGILPMALGSLLAQTYKNWEYIIIGDGCTDYTEEMVNSNIKFMEYEIDFQLKPQDVNH